MRETVFAEGEYYHVYNRGVEHRTIFEDRDDYRRFLESMRLFNRRESIGSIYQQSFTNLIHQPIAHPLVDIVAYCLNPNHYHLLLRQREAGGISNFMKKLGGGYAWYFNSRRHRKGTLFQGPFKAKHVGSNEYLLRLSVYINLNDRVHALSHQVAKYGDNISSWKQYAEEKSNEQVKEFSVHCATNVVLEQFASRAAYGRFADETLDLIREGKEEAKRIQDLSFD